MTDFPVVAIIVPCYNEEEVLPETARQLKLLLDDLIASGRIAEDSHICFVDDGSEDKTWPMITELRARSRGFGGLKLSRNRGHQNALLAGLLTARGDILISMDADLQDDPRAVYDMLDRAKRGADIIYGVRSARTTDSAGKRLTAQWYYRLLRGLGVEIVIDHADYRLMSRRAIEALRQYKETNLFLRALIPQLGFRTEIVTYERAERFAGTSKYPISKMLALAIEGITSFTTKPLRMVTILGIITSVIAIGLTIWALLTTLVLRTAIPGWASTVVPIYLVLGVQLLSLGVIGEYIGKIYMETKRRPTFQIAEALEPHADEIGSCLANWSVTTMTTEADRVESRFASGETQRCDPDIAVRT